MGRIALNRTKILILTPVILVVAAASIVTAIVANSPSHKVGMSVNAQHQTTYINYNGQAGQNALGLLKKHADVQTKHYSFGDLVTSINGTAGNGPKFWTFYVNGKQSMVGASSYTTKDSDKLEWRLQ
jgi:hypothetical protein